VASVWVGYDDEQRSLGELEEGSRTALPIWIDFMREALRDSPERPRPLPAGLVSARISSRTGLLAGADDTDAIYETFMQDTLPAAGTPAGTPNSPNQSGGEPLF
jgi:penicillin-binding protein 1A